MATCLADTLLAANGGQWQKLSDRDISIVEATQYALYDSISLPTSSLNTFYSVYAAFQEPSYRDLQIIKTQLIYVAAGSADTVDTILANGIEFQRMSYWDLRIAALELLSEITLVTDIPTLMADGTVFQRYSALDILRLECAILADFTINTDPDQIQIDGKQFQDCSDRELIIVQDQLLCDLATVPPTPGSPLVTEGGDALVTEGGDALTTQ